MASTIFSGDANYGLQVGTNNGSVDFHAPPEGLSLTGANEGSTLERSETPPNPSIVIPFSRDTDFVERGTILDQIYQKCAVSGSRIALVGLGGVGKSQLAIEYAYRTRDRSPETWVFWVHASNAARFEQSFRDIANCVKIPGRQNLQANIFQLVHDWLRNDRKGKWVLILDNVDDASFLVQAQSIGKEGQTNNISYENLRPLMAYLPQCPNGSILITTRSKSAALKLVEQRDIIVVEPMDRADALILFENKLRRHDDSDDTAELAEALEFMPLAIVQAATYIFQRAPRYSVRDYLRDFQKSDRKKTSLLNYEGEQLRRDWEAKNSIIITWQISFDYIRETRPSAADLLSLMSFFDRQGIPKALLRCREERRNLPEDEKESSDDNQTDITSNSDDDEDSSSQSSVSDVFEEDILALRNYSFISINADSTTFEMHRLVQLATRKWLEVHKQQERWKQQFIMNLYDVVPDNGEYENWPRWQTLFPHAQSAVAQQPEEQDSLRDWASILYQAAWYAERMGKGTEAEEMSVQAMKVRKKILGREHKNTLASIVMVGLAYKLRGQWDAAEELEVQVMEVRKKKLGADHPDTLTSMHNLALTYKNQGRWDAAEDLQVQVRETFKKKLGADHPDTLISMTNLASTFWNQGRWDAAEELNIQVMETSKKKLGADHPDTLTSMNNLALTYMNKGRWDTAEELEVQVIETSKKKLGEDHPNTLISINNLALIYSNQGRWEAAEELQVQVMETHKEKLGADHPDTLTSISNLALIYRNQGRWDTAQELQAQLMETRKKKLGADHPSTLTSMNNLALTFWDQGRWDTAEELQIQVMETRKKKLGADHPDTLTSMANLALIFSNQGRWDAAEELEVQAMEIRKKKLGAYHPDTLRSIANLTSTFWNQGRWDAAEELEVQMMEIRKKKLGADHPDTLTSMANLALIFSNQGRWDAAEELEVQVIEMSIKKLGADHPDTLTSMNNLAFTWKGTGRTAQAITLMEECIQSRKCVLGIDHPDTLSSCSALAAWKAEYRAKRNLKQVEHLLPKTAQLSGPEPRGIKIQSRKW
ncbi:hypothetical protein CJF32_00011333 [Rutstroemia sp. NJR-2017a WRK4]|nr:hypothetical protein CJF32_00011333 [Rutstroemia sp. NJR-2017a WRK4]